MILVRLKPPAVAFSLVGLGAIGHFLMPAAHRRAFACVPCGIALVLIGFSAMIWAWALFRRNKTPILPTSVPTALVTSGPYRFSRNPMYLNIVIILLGIALLVGSLPMYAAPFGFFLFVNFVTIPFEESRLRDVFKEDYVYFCRRVRRWL